VGEKEKEKRRGECTHKEQHKPGGVGFCLASSTCLGHPKVWSGPEKGERRKSRARRQTSLLLFFAKGRSEEGKNAGTYIVFLRLPRLQRRRQLAEAGEKKEEKKGGKERVERMTGVATSVSRTTSSSRRVAVATFIEKKRERKRTSLFPRYWGVEV